MPKVGIISQARMTSTRLPGKVLKTINGKSLLEYHVERLQWSGLPVIIATTTNQTDQPIIEFCKERNLSFHRGSEQDVLSRFYEAAQAEQLDIIIRVTSDCPLIDGKLIGEAAHVYLEKDTPTMYLSNCLQRTYARGFDFEIFSFKLLKEAFEQAKSPSDREHVTPYIHQNKGGQVLFFSLTNPPLADFRLTVDEPDDFRLIEKLIVDFNCAQKSESEISEVLLAHPELQNINSHVEQKKIMILFRCDSSFDIGTGHLIRCLHLAEILKSQGHTVEFLCKNLPGNINKKVKEKGYALHEVDDDLNWIQSKKPKWVVIDHYGIGEDWENALPSGTKIFVIDDLMNRKHKCDVLLDQNFRIRNIIYGTLVPTGCMLLLGPHYALIRPDMEKPKAPKLLPEKPKVLSFFGGADPTGELLKMAKAVSTANPNFTTSLVCLSSHKYLNDLKNLKLPPHVQLLLDTPNWVQTLEAHDFYVGSGGTITWERMYLGLPGAVIAVAPNQEGPSQQLGEAGFQYYWGPSDKFDYSTVVAKIDEALGHKKTSQRISEKGLKLVHKFDPDLAQVVFQ